MLKIIHGADFHLDSPFAGLSPAQAARRRGEQRDLLDALARLAREKGADLVLLAGDLLDSERCCRETAQALRAALASIPCPVFISPGNHDFYSSRSLWAALDWPENVHIFTGGTLERVDLPGCTLWGRAFLEPHQDTSPLEGFSAPGGGKLQIACLHGEVDGRGDYGPISRENIAASGLDYLALGHIHQYSGLEKSGNTFWAYPGCPQGRGFDETGEKGVLYVEAEPGQVTARFVPLAKYRYEVIRLDLSAPDPWSALPGEAGDIICRLVLTGACQPPDLAALERALSPRFCALTLVDDTRLPRDLWARRGEDSLTGLFLRELWEQPEGPLKELAARYGLAALEGGEEP